MVAPKAAADRKSKLSIEETLQALDGTVPDTSLASLSGLGLPHVRTLKREIATIFPSSNLPAFLLQGLLQLRGREVGRDKVTGDLRVLFRETRQIGLYGAFIAAPAMIIYGYQRLLTLAGKDISDAFPDGEWQFYTEFGLREDAARHCVETRGFEQVAAGLGEADAAACWAYAAICTLFSYEDMLANEWRERALLRSVDLALVDEAAARASKQLSRKKGEERERLLADLAAQLAAELGLQRLGVEWGGRRPYHGPAADPIVGYTAARRRTFDSWFEGRMARVGESLRARVNARYEARSATELPAFQAQMTLLQTLRPDTYNERREPLAFEQLTLAFVCGGVYHLLDICERDEAGHLLMTPRGGEPGRPGQSLPLQRTEAGVLTDLYGRPVSISRRGSVRLGDLTAGRLRPASLAHVRAQIAHALRAHRPLRPNTPGAAPPTDLLLAATPRGRQDQLRALLGAQARGEIELLRRAPIVLNWDQHDSRLPLGQLRRTRRGCGDHAMTIIRTDAGTIFDMSHIFFDGAWGSSLAETLTGFASALTVRVRGAKASAPVPPALNLDAPPAFLGAAHETAAQLLPEVNAESGAVNLAAMSALRRRLAERGMELTVNDLLVLARYEHAASYQPGPAALAALDDLSARHAEGARLREQINAWLTQQRDLVPALLIPMDASAVDPRQRLRPATLRNPVPQLLPRLDRCAGLLRQQTRHPDPATEQQLKEERRLLCDDLLLYGRSMRALREITTHGESFTIAALRMLGHLPRPMQSLLDLVPQKIDVLNEIVKGVEVFSNIGQIARSSSLSRFMSSRDDGDTKLLVWGVMSDARGQMLVVLRDFRPHVGPLLTAGHGPLADLLAADFLSAYADATNQMVRRIQRVLAYK